MQQTFGHPPEPWSGCSHSFSESSVVPSATSQVQRHRPPAGVQVSTSTGSLPELDEVVPASRCVPVEGSPEELELLEELVVSSSPLLHAMRTTPRLTAAMAEATATVFMGAIP
jgi:hypothetical protein